MIEFYAQGSGAQPYKVVFSKNDGHVYAGCNCAARKSGIVCKHILGILDGEVTNLINVDTNAFAAVAEMIEGTQFQSDYQDLKHALKYYNNQIITQCKRNMITKRGPEL